MSQTDAVMSDGTWVADRADPLVAVLVNGDAVTAVTEFGGDGDGGGIALRRLRAGQTQPDNVSWASDPAFERTLAPSLSALWVSDPEDCSRPRRLAVPATWDKVEKERKWPADS